MIETGQGLDALEAWRSTYDAAVAASPDIDPFCSRSDWMISFARSHAPDLDVFVARRGDSHLALSRTDHDELGPLWHALEHGWRFASPIAGPGSEHLLLDLLAGEGRTLRPGHSLGTSGGSLDGERDGSDLSHGSVLISGLDPGPRLMHLLMHLQGNHEIYRLPSTGRVVASLQGGLDGYLSRRSRELRRNLRRAGRRARDRGLHIERLVLDDRADVDALYGRVLEVESRSWKALEHMGADREPMRGFYHHLLHRLRVEGRARLLLAHLEGDHVGYMHGGQCGDHFRSFQFSYDDARAELSIGNLLHLELVTWLCEDGVQHYDLGQQVPYKRHWGEGLRTTPNLLVVPR
ncbi:MAG: GNAT family N-acetyltransferase [Pseudomonadota bacterium]